MFERIKSFQGAGPAGRLSKRGAGEKPEPRYSWAISDEAERFLESGTFQTVVNEVREKASEDFNAADPMTPEGQAALVRARMELQALENITAKIRSIADEKKLFGRAAPEE